MKRKLLGPLAVLGLLAVALPAWAHHSPSAEFEVSKFVEIKGVVTKVDWINPHVFVYLDVKDPATGKVTQWALQSLPTRMFHQSGLTKEMLLADGRQEVTAKIWPAKDGSNYGFLARLTLPDGHYFALLPDNLTAK